MWIHHSQCIMGYEFLLTRVCVVVVQLRARWFGYCFQMWKIPRKLRPSCAVICTDLFNFHGTSRSRRAICLPPYERDGSRCYSCEPSMATGWLTCVASLHRCCTISLWGWGWDLEEATRGVRKPRDAGVGRGDGGAPAVPLTSRCDLNSSRTTLTTLGPRWLLSVTVRMMAGLVFSSSNWILFFFLLAPEKPQTLRVSVERVFRPTKSL